ncbi:hypothetical protein [Flavonifractor sp. An4]|uniref:hypothetical protein n=1 Tax=Flavonifractor sp. An4 TaxID=1965634 RepID=UPI000B38DCBE|nr:hypothetical protein [Flavonifractor sp. An4]OUO16175.1 hypothetical protein B5F94_05885 [Flavonifractor sp. An4]
MIRKKFFEDSENGYSSFANLKVFDQVWKKVEAYEQEIGKSLDSGFTKEEFVAMFNSMRIRHTRTLPNHKAVVMFYIRYLIAHGVLPAEQEKILASVTVDDLSIKDGKHIYYHKNLATLQAAINDSVRSADSYDDTLYDLPSAILYLAWYGFTEDEIINFRKDAVLEDGVMKGDEKIEMPYEICRLFERLRDAEGYYQQARGLIFHKYMYSEYLIRTERNPQIDLDNMRGMLYRLNAIAGRVYSLRYDVVYTSGIFYRAYRLECESSSFNLDDPEFASKVFCEDLSNKAKRVARVRDYKLYKQLFT